MVGPKRYLRLIPIFALFFFFSGTDGTQGAYPAGKTSAKKGSGSTSFATPEIIRALGVSWGYDWYINVNAFKKTNYEHVPMVHSWDDLNHVKNVARTYPGRYWLVFNEPDYHAQENLNPAAAAEFYHRLWTAMQEADPTAKLIVGGVLWPAPTWMSNFREEYKKRYGRYPIVQGWHVHHYIEPDKYNIYEWRRVPEFWKNWMNSNGGPVELWLTEFGCLVSNSIGQNIMQDQIPWLEAQPWLTRYAWFNMYIEPTHWFKGTLTLPDMQLSALGQIYATFGSFPPPDSIPTSHSITGTAGSGGAISPSGTITVKSGGSQTFMITANSGYMVADVKVDNVSQGPISSYTFNPVTSDRTIAARFTPQVSRGRPVFVVNCGGPQYTDRSGVVYQADTNYSGGSAFAATNAISGTEDDPLYQTERWGNFSYNIPVSNGSYNVTLKMAEIYSGIGGSGQRVFSVLIEGREVVSNLDLFSRAGSYTAYDVTIPANVTDGVLNIEFRSVSGSAKVNAIVVAPVLSASQYTITATAGANGSISPSGAVTVNQGGSQTFTITPASGHIVGDVKVNGVSKGAISSYTFSNVTANQTIAATFSLPASKQYSLSVNKGGTGEGTVVQSPAGTLLSAGTEVILQAKPGKDSVFSGWSGACSGKSETCRVTMNGNQSVMVHFIPFALERRVTSSQKGTVVDLDGDGRDDVVWFDAETRHTMGWWIRSGRMTIQDLNRDVSEANWKMAGGGNLRPDGSYNIFWHNEGTGKVYAWSMNRGVYLGEHHIRAVEDLQWKMVGVGDFDGDGNVDLLWHHQGTGAVYIWFMNGVNFIRDQHVAAVEDSRWQVVGVGDLNGDGKAEILWQHPEGGVIYIWYMDGGRLVRDQYLRDVEDLNWKVIGIGKFSESKEPNILWRHEGSGERYIWYLEGGQYLGDARIEQ